MGSTGRQCPRANYEYIPSGGSPGVTDEAESLFCPLEFRYGTGTCPRALFAGGAVEPGSSGRSRARAFRGGTRNGTDRRCGGDREGGNPFAGVLGSGRRVGAHSAPRRHGDHSSPRRSGGRGRWVHFGATSADITDTALALELKESATILRDDLTGLARALVDLARKHRARRPRSAGPTGSTAFPSASDTRWRSRPPK